jgi:hypothetical protein
MSSSASGATAAEAAEGPMLADGERPGLIVSCILFFCLN